LEFVTVNGGCGHVSHTFHKLAAMRIVLLLCLCLSGARQCVVDIVGSVGTGEQICGVGNMNQEGLGCASKLFLTCNDLS
jgi:hypothetical protein